MLIKQYTSCFNVTHKSKCSMLVICVIINFPKAVNDYSQIKAVNYSIMLLIATHSTMCR